MFLVVSLGLLHGLFIVPAMLCFLSNMNSSFRAIKMVRIAGLKCHHNINQTISQYSIFSILNEFRAQMIAEGKIR